MQKIYCVRSGGGGRLCFVGIHLYGEGKLLKNSRNILRSWKKKSSQSFLAFWFKSLNTFI